ncbi:NAD(P)H dehydrogenase (quinone) [Spizellomyces sp. 'palustris']|nr:NAD(P)H dehydrogenase (quinone) [Spizellomyces sp. 'palustris']
MGGKISKTLKKAKTKRRSAETSADAQGSAVATPAPAAPSAPASSAPTSDAAGPATDAQKETVPHDSTIGPVSSAPTVDKELPVASEVKAETATGATTAKGDASADADALKSSPPTDQLAAPVKSSPARKPKIYVIIHSNWGHDKQLADAIMKGLEEGGAEAKVWRVRETLSTEVLEKMHASTAFEDIPIIEPEQMVEPDGFLFGIPTRYGTQPAQVKTFWDGTGNLWQKGALIGKYGGLFFSTATQHGGQETAAFSFLPHFAHHGILFVPIGYTTPILNDNTEVVGGSPYGAGTIAGGDGSRQPSQKELDIGIHQGKHFAAIVSRSLSA